MNRLVIFMVSCGPNACEKNIRLTLESIHKHIGTSDYKVYAFVDKNELKKVYEKYINAENIHRIAISNKGIGEQFNEFFDDIKDQYTYLIYSHDDLLLHTSYIYQKTMGVIYNTNKELGFITYSNVGYQMYEKLVSNSVRPGIAKDRFNYPKVFECRHGSLDKIEFPKRPLEVFGPFSHFNFVNTKAMKEIGYSAIWTPTPMLMDEDWALSSNIKGFVNVWIPYIRYEHPIQETEKDRVTTNLARHTPQSHLAFLTKWGVDIPYSESDIKKLKELYGKTRLKYFFDKNTYDWRYL